MNSVEKISFSRYAFPIFCKQMFRSLAYGVRISKVSATAVISETWHEGLRIFGNWRPSWCSYCAVYEMVWQPLSSRKTKLSRQCSASFVKSSRVAGSFAQLGFQFLGLIFWFNFCFIKVVSSCELFKWLSMKLIETSTQITMTRGQRQFFGQRWLACTASELNPGMVRVIIANISTPLGHEHSYASSVRLSRLQKKRIWIIQIYRSHPG